MSHFIINGKFLSQRVSGVQRFAREIVAELDAIVEKDTFELVAPVNAQNIPELKNIKVVLSSHKASIVWEQFWLPFYIKKKKGIGLHLCHVAPILKPDIVCIHDANVVSNPRWFSKKVYLWYFLVDFFCARFAKRILTVSCFSKKELQKHLKIEKKDIKVLIEGWQHLNRTQSDSKTVSRYGLCKKGFYFSLGTQAQYKNMKWVYDYALQHPNEKFAISGSSNGKIFRKETSKMPDNICFLGYLSDEEVKSLMQNCKAFLFPSFYEGFGIPPLEALSVGCPIVVSDIPVMHEIFGKTAHYIDPNNSVVDLDDLIAKPIESPKQVLEKYSWKIAAKMLKMVIDEYR